MPTVLVIEDDAAIRNLCRIVLEGAGYGVETAENGAEGLRLVREHAPDLVLCDIYMPEMDGLEAIPKLAREALGLTIIAMSGGAGRLPDFLPLAKHFGAAYTLAKPFSPDELLDVVHAALGDEACGSVPVPLSFAIDETTRLVSLRYDRDVSYREFEDAMTAVFGDPRFRPGFSFLADRRQAAVPSAEYARRAAVFLEQHAASFGESHWATVVDSPAADAVIRIVEAISDRLPVEVRVFTDPAAARAWLGAEPAGSH